MKTYNIHSKAMTAHMEHCTDVRNDLLQPTALDQLTTESFDDSNCNSITNLWTCCTPASKQNKNTCNVIDTDPKNSDQLNNTDQSFAGNAIRLLQKPQFNKSRQNYVDTDSKIMVKIASLNEYITCGVCRGYLFEAATITECMHSFCKSCIYKHVQVNLHCPTCKLLIHPTDPFVNIRLDRLLQDIVYGLIPHLLEDELEREEKFYADEKFSPNEQRKFASKFLSTKLPYTSDLQEFKLAIPNKIHPVSLHLECKESSPLEKTLEKCFVCVTGQATISNVAEFIRKKLLLTTDYVIVLYCGANENCVNLDSSNRLWVIKEQYCREQEFLLLEYEISPRQWLL